MVISCCRALSLQGSSSELFYLTVITFHSVSEWNTICWPCVNYGSHSHHSRSAYMLRWLIQFEDYNMRDDIVCDVQQCVVLECWMGGFFLKVCFYFVGYIDFVCLSGDWKKERKTQSCECSLVTSALFRQGSKDRIPGHLFGFTRLAKAQPQV